MRLPKIVLFDYGETLMSESPISGLRGTEAVMAYAVGNRDNLTAQEVFDFSLEVNRLLQRFDGRAPDTTGRIIPEIHNHKFQHFVYEYLGITLSLTPEEEETLWWDQAAPPHLTPGIGELLAYLQKRGIRTGVISNLSFSGSSLENRIKSLLPDNHFEFVIATSEYVFRKPHPMIFNLALRKAGVAPEDAWYCGDSIHFDVQGANSAGMFPVWYTAKEENGPSFDHLKISHWQELIDTLENM